MNPFIGSNLAVSCLALVLLILCSGGQVVHGYLRAAYSKPQSRPLAITYESALFVHLIVMSLFVFESLQGQSTVHLHLFGLSIPFDTVLWINIVVLAIAGFTALAGLAGAMDASPAEDPGWMPPIEAALAFLCIPTAIAYAGSYWIIILYFDAVYYLFRTMYLLFLDMRIRSHAVSPLSVTEALKAFPEGLLYADDKGRTLIANAAMRHCLSALGLPTDFAHVEELWMLLNEKASGPNAIEPIEGISFDDDSLVVLRIGPDEIRLFSFEGSGFKSELPDMPTRALEENPVYMNAAKQLFGTEPDMRIIAFDITQEVEVLREIERTNAELAAQQAELQASMETVQEAAENEAMLRMRGRVHDVIGQRLSLLHRALEDNAVSDEQLDRLKPLLNGILNDLAAETAANPTDELAATIAAFELTGVTVNVMGELPKDPKRAKVFADCIRESTTNAVKHARSTTVNATITPTSLAVTNDGPLPTMPLHEGTGLTNMRRAAASIGAILSFEVVEASFTVRLDIPAQ